ncbi:hypothetical protein Dimus_019379 [Dionaea muscipula]
MMMRRASPPKHRHDGNSPLPLGMDWSPPPKKWNGRDTIWPHDPQTGWSYCVMIPSWIALPKSRSSASDPVVFYRVQVAIQSPAGVTTTRGVLRRFNDFLKLYSDLKQAFPKKSIPSAPPRGLLRMRSKALLEERRCSLEEWMTKLLSDIDISRSISVASFLELEAAARSSFQETNQEVPEADTDPNGTIYLHQSHAGSSLSPLSASITSDFGSETIYEASETGTPCIGRDDSSDVGTEYLMFDEDLTNPIEKLVKYGMSNIDEGLLMGASILDQLEAPPRNEAVGSHFTDNENASKAAFLSVSGMDALFEAAEPVKEVGHTRRLSNESIGSDLGSYGRSEISNSGTPNFLSEACLDFPGVAETSRTKSRGAVDSKLPNGTQIVIPVDQRSKLNRVLMIMQRRLVTAKTDMEDLISRLNQEITGKEYLTTKVKDLEVELETTRQKSKENLQQALLIEKERVTKMQWDMEELRRKSVEMELRLKSQKGDKSNGDTCSSSNEKDGLQQELDASKEQLNKLLRQHEELEVKSKSDIKVLVKEVKSLRKSRNELQQQLAKSVEEKLEVKRLLQHEKEKIEHALAARRKLMHECEILHNQLQECSTKYIKDGNIVEGSSTIPIILDLLAESDDKIIDLLVEAKSFKQNDITQHDILDELNGMDDELRKMLGDIFVDNAKLRKQVTLFVHSALKTGRDSKKDDGKEAQSIDALLE